MDDQRRFPLPNQRTLPPLQLNWFELMQKNKPQSNAAAGGIMLLMVSGYHIGWTIWRSYYPGYWWRPLPAGLFIFIMTSWFVSAIIGSIMGAYTVSNWRKKTIYYHCCVLLVISSVLFIVGYESYEAILISRILAGLAHGIVYITTLTHLTENLVKEIRGRSLAVINYMLITSIFVTTAIFGTTGEERLAKADMYFGIITLVHSLLGLLMIPFLTCESVSFLLRKGLEYEALTTMMKLRNETFETWTIRNDFQELKQMVSEDANDGLNIVTKGNLRPLILITAIRVLAFLTSNMILNAIMIGLTQSVFSGNADLSFIGGVALAFARFLLAVISLFALDHFKRKRLLSITGGIMVIVLLVYTVLSLGFQLELEDNWLPALFFCVFQVLVSLGIDPLHHVLTAEAFNSSPKAYWSISFVTCIEHILHIVAIIIFMTITVNVYTMLFITAIGAFLLHLILEFYMPETKGLSVRQARRVFRGQHTEFMVSN